MEAAMLTKMTDRTTLNNGVTMPWLGLGVWKTAEGEEVENAVRMAIQAGYRSIDTAAIYKNEVGVGKGIQQSGVPREELFITTKVWNGDQGYESALRAFEESLSKLGLDYLDLYLIHWPGKDKYKETWRALEQLYRDGKVRAIGVSNFQIHHLTELMKDSDIVPAVNQVEYHPRLSQKELLQFCQSKGIQLEAWSPLMQGGELLMHPTLQQIGEKYGKTPAQVILRWDVQNGVVTIPKSVREQRIRENSDFFNFSLSLEDMQQIDALNENKRVGSNPDEVIF
jgi:methylglyoxal/glyoxal reductase